MKLRLLLALAAVLVGSPFSLRAAIVETYTYSALNQFIPDGNPAGVSHTQTIVSEIDAITNVRVSISIGAASGVGNTAFNGDLYVYLQHDSGISFLLNRVGVTASNAFGYGDNGLNVTFDDSAASDVHLYQLVTVPAMGAPLLGVWQPDGRSADPNLVLDSSPRTSLLSSFNGLNADGAWTLFAADLSTGAQHVLNSYSIEITGVPEPTALALLVPMLLTAAARRRR